MDILDIGAAVSQSKGYTDQYLTTGSTPMGSWNASTNTPHITQGSGSIGQYYDVVEAGTWDGVDFLVGDRLLFAANSNKWERIPTGVEQDASPMVVAFIDQTITNLPTTRTSGKPLVVSDSVKVKSTATLPFEVNGITFDSYLDEAEWNGTAWQEKSYQAGKTNEIKVNKPLEESLSGIADYQSDVNKEFVKEHLKELRFRGYYSVATPTGSIKEGSVWYESDTLSTTFPLQVKTYTNGAWSLATSDYTPADFDVLINQTKNDVNYCFNNEWKDFGGDVFTDTDDLTTITNPSNQTIYRLNYKIYKINGARAENVIFYKSLGSTVVSNTGVSVNGQPEVAYEDIVISDIIDWISAGYIEVGTYSNGTFAKYENSTGSILFNIKTAFTEEDAYDLYFNPTGTAGVDNFIKISSSDESAASYNDLTNKPKINGEVIVGNKSSVDYKISRELSEAQYTALSEEEKNNGTSYYVDDGSSGSSNVEVTSFNNLTDKPSVNGITLRAGLTSADLDMYTRAETDAKFSGVFSYKGVVADIAHLPSASDSKAGDVYYVTDESASFAFNGSAYENIGGAVDLSAYQTKQDNALETTSKNITGAINELNTNKTNKSDIVDNLTTDDATKMLSAKQGKVLQDTKETLANKVTSITKDSTNTEYSSAKAVFDYSAPFDSVANLTSGNVDSNDCVFNVEGYTTQRSIRQKVFFGRILDPIANGNKWGRVITTVNVTESETIIEQRFTMMFNFVGQYHRVEFYRLGHLDVSYGTAIYDNRANIVWLPWYPTEYPATDIPLINSWTADTAQISITGGNAIFSFRQLKLVSGTQGRIAQIGYGFPMKSRTVRAYSSMETLTSAQSALAEVGIESTSIAINLYGWTTGRAYYGQIVAPLGY